MGDTGHHRMRLPPARLWEVRERVYDGEGCGQTRVPPGLLRAPPSGTEVSRWDLMVHCQTFAQLSPPAEAASFCVLLPALQRTPS